MSQTIQLDQLGIMADIASNTMDAGSMFTRLWLLNDPNGDATVSWRSSSDSVYDVQGSIDLNSWWNLPLATGIPSSRITMDYYASQTPGPLSGKLSPI